MGLRLDESHSPSQEKPALHPPSSRYEERKKAFLATVRVGIDAGLEQGGLAVVKGTKILHAETWLEKHDTTVEEKRQLRRARRTRESKKRRLARLRSWVLRQKLPDGTRLPDPYRLMRSPEYFSAPAYLLKIQGSTSNRSQRNHPERVTWESLAERPEIVTPEVFVRALTIIFQKRGFKYDNRQLSELDDKEFLELLKSVRLSDPETRKEFVKEIARRKDQSGPAKIYDELETALERARSAERKPRTAEPRHTRESDLKNLVDVFGKKFNLTNQQIEQWRNQLVRLLNKVIRPARFENRIRSGCAWCGKATPRKAKVRELAYEAAVHNLRKEVGRRKVRLSPAEIDQIRQWWNDVKKPSKTTIRNHLKKLGAQTKMANQLYDLLHNEAPKGRASFCREHLKMAAEGKTMKDAGIEWQTLAPRKAPNPKREQHDQRLVARLEQILFKPGKKGEEAWRFGPVEFISLEIPEPETERKGKGEQTERKTTSFKERVLQQNGGKCIYCNEKEATEVDHIFPRSPSKGGPDRQDNRAPACRDCNQEKGDRTPREWLQGEKWKEFEQRVNELHKKGKISDRGKELLLNENQEYPDNPTPLAIAGSRPKQLYLLIKGLFEKYDVAAPTLEYRVGVPHFQLVRGSLTQKLRYSWLTKHDGSPNFPQKNDDDILNHAQDAVLAAAAPPHTWREQIFRWSAVRTTRTGEQKEVPDLADHCLAPDWATFFSNLPEKHETCGISHHTCGGNPPVRQLGRERITWRIKFADETFGAKPPPGSSNRIFKRESLANLEVALSNGNLQLKNADNENEIDRIACDIINDVLEVAGTIVEKFKEAQEELAAKCPRTGDLAKAVFRSKPKIERLVSAGYGKDQDAPATAEITLAHLADAIGKCLEELSQAQGPGSPIVQDLRKRLEDIKSRKSYKHTYAHCRRLKIGNQPGGTVGIVKPKDGPPRRVQIKPASEAAILWEVPKEGGSKFKLSIVRPRPMLKFFRPDIDEPFSRCEPAPEKGWKRLARIKRGDLFFFSGKNGSASGSGFYLVTKLSQSQITTELVIALDRNGAVSGAEPAADTETDKTVNQAQTSPDGKPVKQKKRKEKSWSARELATALKLGSAAGAPLAS